MSAVDVNVKNVEADVMARLTEQAKAEGMSQQEWIRQTLRRSASRLSPAELLAGRATSEPMGEEEFRQVRQRATAARRSAVAGLDARQPRR